MKFRIAGISSIIIRLVVCTLAIFAMVAPPAWSQATTTGTITGQVTDAQNASIPGVEVKLIDTATGTAQTTSINEAGRYIFVNVASGVYNLTFGKAVLAQA